MAQLDPYRVLGVDPSAPDADVRAAYRRLVQLHHPDHNGGSADSARRFEEVQGAYAEVRELRRREPLSGRRPRSPRADAPPRRQPPPGAPPDPGLEARLAAMERDLREAQLARERARRAAREAAAADRERPSDEELGYVTTDDRFSKILDDAGAELAKLWRESREQGVGKHVADTLDELADKLTGEQPPRRPG
jgi:curved DNA-binding protein CbpA